ncbi:unnamed protein product [Rotaria sordida]|uniref:Uncharacterized protein n=1 Tax=Rotaria sordida TaxID=392033 RepID=A0A815QDM9_9BILA|nr:unnamed protein product [Rotaria sordida]CAF4094508.1 unnamed protein product [Rotaria sordida]
MGVVSSMCKRKKKRGNHDAIVHNNYTQTVDVSPSISSNQTQWSAMSREPTNNSSFRYQFYLPPNQQLYSTSAKQIRGYADFPLFSTPFYLPFNGQSNLSYNRSNPYVAQAYSHIDAPTLPSIYNIGRSRSILTTSTTDPSHVTSTTDVIQTTGNEHRTESYRTLKHVESSMTTDKNEQSFKENIDDESHLVKRSVSAPIDMFLIDISKEHARIGQPVSMNIRHLLLDTLENNHRNSSTPIRIEPTSITKYAHENLLNYIPYVCERYPNVTVDSNQLTRNTLHVRIPSQFSRSLNVLT